MSCYNINLGKQTAQAMPCRAQPGSNSTFNSQLIGNPCVHLACVLDKINCTTVTTDIKAAAASPNSSATSSTGSFCTGKLVAVPAQQSYPQAKALLGLPCIANEDPVPGLKQCLAALKHLGVQSCSNNPSNCPLAPGTYVQQGWRVCSCEGGMLLSTAVADLLSEPSV
jgi:hypothetical protein